MRWRRLVVTLVLVNNQLQIRADPDGDPTPLTGEGRLLALVHVSLVTSDGCICLVSVARK